MKTICSHHGSYMDMFKKHYRNTMCAIKSETLLHVKNSRSYEAKIVGNKDGLNIYNQVVFALVNTA